MNYYLWKRSHHKLVLPSYSFWPLLGSISGFLITLGSVKWWHKKNLNIVLITGIFLLLLKMLVWWRDLINEGMSGDQMSSYLMNIQLGVMLFILSEVLFFFSFFWGFFHMCWSPGEEMGINWPPVFFKEIIIDPFSVPLLKTIMLLSSGATVTASHFYILMSEKPQNYYKGLMFLGLTVLLGIVFLYLQLEEYASSYLSFNSSVYGSMFFILTGFHGLHVTIGAMALFVCLIRLFKLTFSSFDHLGFEGSAWYWHFVDVVWLFLYMFIYWLGSPL